MILKKQILSCVEEVLGRTLSQEDMMLNPVDDLDFDSILLVDLILRIEDVFHINFTDFASLSENAGTLGDLVSYLCEEVKRMIGESNVKTI